MMSKSQLRLLALSTTCLFPLMASAQDSFDLDAAPAPQAPVPVFNSFIEGGVGHMTDDAPWHGRFTGRDSDGTYGLGTLSLLQRDPLGTEYWKIDASNVGLDSRAMRAEYGHQGSYKAFVNYDEIPALHHLTGNVTPYVGAGSGSLTLPAGLGLPGAGPAANVYTAAGLSTYMREVEIGQERRRAGGGLNFAISPNLTFATKFQREEKEGLKTLGIVFGSSPGAPFSIVPEPVNYTTDDFKASLAYNTGRFQVEAGYGLSLFTNDTPVLRVANPWDIVPPAPPAQDLSTPSAAYQLAPDNTAHQITLAGGYNLSDVTRITANFGYSWYLQDEAFLPYTSNPGITIINPLPRNSLDGKLVNTTGSVALSTRFSPTLDFRARYRYTDRDNETPQAQFLTDPLNPLNCFGAYNEVTGDSTVQNTATNGGKCRINHPYSYTEHFASADLGYRVMPGTRLTGGYDLRLFERTHSEVDENTEHTGRVKVTSRLGSNLHGSLGYARSQRSGSEYRGDAPFREGQHPDYVIAKNINPALRWENHPLLRKSFEADRSKDNVTAGLRYLPTEVLSVGVSGAYTNEDYTDSVLGLTGVKSWNGTVDLDINPSSKLSAFAFYTYDDHEAEQASWKVEGATNAAAFDPRNRWWMDYGDRSHTAGFGANYAMSDKLSLGAQYIYARVETSYEFRSNGATGTSAINTVTGVQTTGANTGVQPLPDTKANIHTLGLNADYSIRPNIVLRLAYALEMYDGSDWAVDNIGTLVNSGAANAGLLMGEASPDYMAHFIGVATRVKF